MRSILEIKNYLKRKDFSDINIENTIEKLKKEGYLNEEIFIKAYIQDQYNLTNNGPLKIKNGLIKLGISEDKINIDLDFNEKINKLIEKKVKQNHKLNTYELKMNITNYLIRLGYSKDSFEEYLDNIEVDDSALIKKEYDKLYSKYKTKYKEKKLMYYLRDRLYKKGYSIDLINEIINEEDL